MKALRIAVISLCLMSVAGVCMAQRGLPVTVPQLISKSLEYERSGKLRDALNAMLRALRTEPYNYYVNLRTGWLYYRLGEYNKSIDQYQRLVEWKPKAIEPRLGLSLPLMASGKWTEAESVIRKTARNEPGNYIAMARLAYILYSLGKYSEAAQQYQAVLERFPSDATMMAGLAWSYLKAGNVDSARGVFTNVLTIRPSHASAITGLRLCYQR